MDNLRGTLPIKMSKSTPSVITIPVDKKMKHTMGNIKKPLLTGKQQCHGFKRNILANPEKSVAQRKPYLIIEEDINLTPKALYDSNFPSCSEKIFAGLPAAKPLGSVRSDRIAESPSTSSMHSLISRMSFSRRSRSSLALSLYSVGITSAGEFSWTSIGHRGEEEEELELKPDDRAPSMFRLREDPPPRVSSIQTKFIITLKETETMFLLELPTGAESSLSEEGKEIMECNKLYENLLQTSKTVSHTATQTTRVFQKHRKLHAPRNQRANASAFASIWDIYDSYEQVRRDSIKSILAREEGQVDQIVVTREEENYNEEFEYLGYKFDARFLNALMTMERLIVKNDFSEKQLTFQGLLVQDPLSVDVKYNYNLTHLWTFSNEHSRKRKVTSMCWSAENSNILAVGYGKFKYVDKCDGLVCVWNIKNPQTPERQFEFEDPVTFVTFSHFRSQILAVSFYSGLVLLLDIINRSTMIKASNQNYPLFHPVWQTRWFPNEGKMPGNFLVTCGKNGRVYRYKKTKFFISKKIMSMGRPHGSIQGVEQLKNCYPRKTLSCRHPSAEVLIQHPTDPLMYLVGTSEGCVYFCSVNHRHDHIDVFVAHNGPVYTIQYNPFCSKVFLTCGADWCIRIWAEGVFEPLVCLESGMTAVQDALWSPLHSTVIISITGTFIEVWDIRRKTVTPKSSTESPSKSFNTVIQFTANKFNVCVGDVDGNVHVLALSEMPFSPAFQEDILAHSILNLHISRPDVQEKLVRLGHPFASEGFSYMTRLYRKLNNLHKDI